MNELREAFEAAWVAMFNVMNSTHPQAGSPSPTAYQVAKEWREKYKSLWENKERRMK